MVPMKLHRRGNDMIPGAGLIRISTLASSGEHGMDMRKGEMLWLHSVKYGRS